MSYLFNVLVIPHNAFGLALVDYRDKREKNGTITRIYKFR